MVIVSPTFMALAAVFLVLPGKQQVVILGTEGWHLLWCLRKSPCVTVCPLWHNRLKCWGHCQQVIFWPKRSCRGSVYVCVHAYGGVWRVGWGGQSSTHTKTHFVTASVCVCRSPAVCGESSLSLQGKKRKWPFQQLSQSFTICSA